jgi:hypothetical protein
MAAASLVAPLVSLDYQRFIQLAGAAWRRSRVPVPRDLNSPGKSEGLGRSTWPLTARCQQACLIIGSPIVSRADARQICSCGTINPGNRGRASWCLSSKAGGWSWSEFAAIGGCGGSSCSAPPHATISPQRAREAPLHLAQGIMPVAYTMPR